MQTLIKDYTAIISSENPIFSAHFQKIRQNFIQMCIHKEDEYRKLEEKKEYIRENLVLPIYENDIEKVKQFLTTNRYDKYCHDSYRLGLRDYDYEKDSYPICEADIFYFAYLDSLKDEHSDIDPLFSVVGKIVPTLNVDQKNLFESYKLELQRSFNKKDTRVNSEQTYAALVNLGMFASTTNTPAVSEDTRKISGIGLRFLYQE